MSRSRPSAAFVVLGGDETGLAVVRNVAARGERACVLARSGDVTTRSRLAECVIADEHDAAGALELLLELGEPGVRPLLLATNDRWLRFIMAHRNTLAEHFTVLHPKNAVLEICLNKRRFAEWCSAHQLPTPAVIDLDEDAETPRHDAPRFPLILRPESSNQLPADRVPKARTVTTPEELRSSLAVFEAAGSRWVATRSLLPEAREQYSVGVAVRGDRQLSFVAQKLRPWPERCAVGSYVALRPHAAAESLAHQVLRRLGFEFGMAEVEIIRVASGELFVIEVNPRPWSQFALSYRSGHDFLSFLLGPTASPARRRRREGLAWIAFGTDLFTCFSRTAGLVRHRRLTIFDYVRSLARVRVSSRFAFSDPLPALHSILPAAGEQPRRPSQAQLPAFRPPESS